MYLAPVRLVSLENNQKVKGLNINLGILRGKLEVKWFLTKLLPYATFFSIDAALIFHCTPDTYRIMHCGLSGYFVAVVDVGIDKRLYKTL